MFRYPATSVFNTAGGYTVAHSVEQYEALLAEGWLAVAPALVVEPEPEPEPEPVIEGRIGRKCSLCGEAGHTVRTCTAKEG